MEYWERTSPDEYQSFQSALTAQFWERRNNGLTPNYLDHLVAPHAIGLDARNYRRAFTNYHQATTPLYIQMLEADSPVYIHNLILVFGARGAAEHAKMHMHSFYFDPVVRDPRAVPLVEPSRAEIRSFADEIQQNRGTLLGQRFRGGSVARIWGEHGEVLTQTRTNGSPRFGRHPVIESLETTLENLSGTGQHGNCGEWEAASGYLFEYQRNTGIKVTTLAQAREAFRGVKIQTAYVKGPNSLQQDVHGTPQDPCGSCELFLKVIGIEYSK